MAKKLEIKAEEVDVSAEFEKVDNASYENAQIRSILSQILEANKDNEALNEYITLLKKLEENEEIIDTGKKVLYEGMNYQDIDCLDGKSVSAVLTRPYTKKEFDKDKFIEDYSEEKYNEYMTEKVVKGNVKIKLVG